MHIPQFALVLIGKIKSAEVKDLAKGLEDYEFIDCRYK